MKWRWLAILVLAALGGGGGLACANRPVLSDVRVDPARIRPDGSSIGDQAKIQYTLGRRAYVTLSIIAPNGEAHVLRDAVLRAPDQYEVRFDGSVSTGEGPNRRVLGDGSYVLKIRAVDVDGDSAEETRALAIEGADTSPLEVGNLVIQPTTITPNSDGTDDEAAISYALSKKAEVTVFATDREGNFALLQPPAEQEGEAGLAAPWDGKENGGRPLPNGRYTIHIRAADKSGNVAEAAQEVAIENAGTPRMSISRVKFWPPVVPLNGTLHVEITVKNIGDTIIKTLGPDPGTRYTINSSYASFRDAGGVPIYYEKPGFWRAGVMWNNAPQPYPVRWGFGRELKPGDEVTVGGQIVIDAELSRTGIFFWAGIEQGGVGFHDTNRGQTEIRISR